MNDSDYSQQFLERLSVRDFDGLKALFAPDATARFLLPRGVEEQAGGEAIVGRFQDWFAGASLFQVARCGDDRIGGRRRLDWNLRVVRTTEVPEDIQQIAFLWIGPGGIEQLDLICSGFHLAEADAESSEAV